jgi:GAF domain-containing protein/HAMP domain-containing protein
MIQPTPLTPSAPPVQLDRAALATRVTLVATVVNVVFSLALLILAFAVPHPQLFFLAGGFAVAWILSGFVTSNASLSAETRILVALVGTLLAQLLVATLINGVGIPSAALILILSIVISAAGLSSQRSDIGITVGLGFALLAAFLSTVPGIHRLEFPALQIIIPAVLGILVMIYIALLAMNFITANLRVKFITGSLAIAIIPLVLLSFIQSRFVQEALQNQTNQALRLAAEQVASQIDDFLQTNLLTVEQEASLPAVVDYLAMDPAKRAGSPEEQRLRLALESMQTKQYANLYSYGIINMVGENIYDTDPYQIGQNERSYDYYNEPVSSGQAYISNLTFSRQNQDALIVFSAPIRNDEQQILGILRMRYDAAVFQQLLEGYTNLLGRRSYPILIDDNLLRIGDTMTPKWLYQPVVPISQDVLGRMQRRSLTLPEGSIQPTNLIDFEAGVRNYLNTPYFTAELHPDSGHLESAAIVRLTNQTWYVIFAQEQTALTALLNRQTQLSTLVATLIAALIGVVATLFSRVLSNPIIDLQETASRIAGGSLEAQAKVESNDEIGALGRAFNSMTQQLRTFIAELEDRVRERTLELAHQNEALRYRSNQLRTVADVARDVASAQELETLLTNVARLISERFGFYHVGIFLLDEAGEFAVLRAANSEGGSRMLARRHQLKVGQVGIVGYVTGSGQPRIATDVGQDAVFFNNPDLPQTRSEMALPLMAAGRVIGALDVQSIESNAFGSEDIDLFSTLADQIAIAIQNNRLFQETIDALAEAKEVHRRYLERQWNQEVADHPRMAYRFSGNSLIVEPAGEDATMLQAIETGNTVLQSGQNQETQFAVPIILRGTSVGAIRIQSRGDENRRWSEEELETVRAVAEQVGQALENARLFEQTVRRAERERKVYEITSKIRSTNDPRQMLQVALQELQATLKASRAQIVLNPDETMGESQKNKLHEQERQAS